MCWFFLLPVKVEGKSRLNPSSSYVFVANHQGAYDIFLIYGFIGRNFKWMMKKSIRRIPLFGKSGCVSGRFTKFYRSYGQFQTGRFPAGQ